MPKLTAEEKAALKAEKKLEKLRQIELLRRKLKHDHIAREVKYGKLTIKEHERDWKKMLVDIALPRMKSDLEYAWHNFERTVDVKDFTISLLLDELNNAEEQYMMNLRNHAEHIDNLVTRFGDNLNELKLANDDNLSIMQARAEKEIEDIQMNANDAEEYFKTMLFGLEVAQKEQVKLVRGDYLSKIDEETNKYYNIISNLRAELERNYSALWDDTKTFLNEFKQATLGRQKGYNVLSLQDEAIQKVCHQQQLKLLRMQDAYKKLKTQYLQLQKIQCQKLTDLENERQYFADAFLTLKARFKDDRTVDSTNLTVLTVESNLTRMHLNDIVTKGKKILALATVCRKLETTTEKILPFPKYETDSTETEEPHIEELKSIANLEPFWRHVAQADGVRHSINEEREYLKRENQILKEKIHEHCQCLDCPSLTQEPTQSRTGNVNVTDAYILQKQYEKFNK